MSFPRYENYKDSRIEWLGEVPEHWEVCALKRIAMLKSGDTINSDSIEEIGDFPVFGGNGLRGYTTSSTHEGIYALIGRQGALCGNINYAQGKFWASEHAVVVSPLNSVETYWLGELLRAMNLNQYSTSAAQPGLSVEIICNLLVPLPPLDEQSSIATFLGRETAKIDALIVEQQRLIELLKEKRQSVISHAVTKGLNPNAPMKDSGIEWLGEVPEHWNKMVAKRVTNVFVPQRNKPELNDEGDGVFWATMEDMKKDEINQTGFWVSEKATKDAGSRILSKGAVIASCVGNFGVASINVVDVIINQQLQAYIPKPVLKAEYLRYFLDVAKVYFERVGTAATLTYVNQQGFENLPLVLPPLLEQENIISYLSFEASKFEKLINEAKTAITLLQERRTALISAAVTGKIDVRGLVSAKTEVKAETVPC